MSPEVAQQVVVGITLIGAVVWLVSLRFVLRSRRLSRSAENHLLDEPSTSNVLRGFVESSGDASALSGKAAELLAGEALGPVKIVDKTNDHIAFERLASGISRRSPGRWFRRGELRFTRLGQNRTQIEWLVEPGNFQWLLWAAGIVLFLGLVALAVGCWAMLTFVASSDSSTIRWQSLQMLQVSHLLWPPFLFAGLYRKGMHALQAEIQAFASNLQYLGDEQKRSR